jgi:hypothetical protein
MSFTICIFYRTRFKAYQRIKNLESGGWDYGLVATFRVITDVFILLQIIQDKSPFYMIFVKKMAEVFDCF